MKLSDIYINKAYAKLIIENNLKDKVMNMVDIFLYNENIFHRFYNKKCRVLFVYGDSCHGNVNVNGRDCRIPHKGRDLIYMRDTVILIGGVRRNKVSISMFGENVDIYLLFSDIREIGDWCITLDKLLDREI